MTATAAQQQFNQYPSRPFKPDIWHRLPKIDKREDLKALVYVYLINGGQIERAPPKKSRGAGRPRIFGKDRDQLPTIVIPYAFLVVTTSHRAARAGHRSLCVTTAPASAMLPVTPGSVIPTSAVL